MLHKDILRMLSEDRGVSPVIGVILMVAVTVVLAALIGAFVFGLGDSLGASTPNAQIDFSYQSGTDTLTVSHDGGQTINPSNTGAIFLTGSAAIDENDYDWNDNSFDGDGTRGAMSGGSVSAGTRIVTIEFDESVSSGDSIAVQWEAPDGDQTATLGNFGLP